MRRIQRALDSGCRYGVLERFFPRLVLWRVPSDAADDGPADGGAPGAGASRHHLLPSWSWMSRNHIEFFPRSDVLTESGAIRFGPAPLDLCAEIRVLRCSGTERRGVRLVILGRDGGVVGELWFDACRETEMVKECVVVAKDWDGTCYVLLVEQWKDGGLERNGLYRRVGVGWIKSHCVSNHHWDGTIV
jgi:hypothetical protein